MLQVRARSFVSAHPHFVRVRAYTLDRCSTLQVRARSFERGPSLRSGPGLTFLTWLKASSPGTIFCECPPPRSFAALYGAAAGAWSRARTRAAKSCGVRGSHFPALFDYFNLESNFVSPDLGRPPP